MKGRLAYDSPATYDEGILLKTGQPIAHGQDKLPLPADMTDVENMDFPKLKADQCAGLGSDSWQVFDSLHAAGEYAKEWVSIHLTGEYKIYDARQQLVKIVMNGQPCGDLHAAWQASRPKPWWKFWK